MTTINSQEAQNLPQKKAGSTLLTILFLVLCSAILLLFGGVAVWLVVKLVQLIIYLLSGDYGWLTGTWIWIVLGIGAVVLVVVCWSKMSGMIRAIVVATLIIFVVAPLLRVQLMNAYPPRVYEIKPSFTTEQCQNGSTQRKQQVDYPEIKPGKNGRVSLKKGLTYQYTRKIGVADDWRSDGNNTLLYQMRDIPSYHWKLVFKDGKYSIADGSVSTCEGVCLITPEEDFTGTFKRM